MRHFLSGGKVVERSTVLKRLLEVVNDKWHECSEAIVPLSRELESVGLSTDMEERQAEIERIKYDHNFHRLQWELLGKQKECLVTLIGKSHHQSKLDTVGSLVQLSEKDQVFYILILPTTPVVNELDFPDGKVNIISIDTPLASAILLANGNQEVEICAPHGKRCYQILGVY